eukprot:scaffold114793_cov23-Tisochrysis_lutea.AAC.1
MAVAGRCGNGSVGESSGGRTLAPGPAVKPPTKACDDVTCRNSRVEQSSMGRTLAPGPADRPPTDKSVLASAGTAG